MPGGGRHSWARFHDSGRGSQGSRTGRESAGPFIGPRQGMG
ncbi:unnamed protein product, partial [Gulo gulo]